MHQRVLEYMEALPIEERTVFAGRYVNALGVLGLPVIGHAGRRILGVAAATLAQRVLVGEIIEDGRGVCDLFGVPAAPGAPSDGQQTWQGLQKEMRQPMCNQCPIVDDCRYRELPKPSARRT